MKKSAGEKPEVTVKLNSALPIPPENRGFVIEKRGFCTWADAASPRLGSCVRAMTTKHAATLSERSRAHMTPGELA